MEPYRKTERENGQLRDCGHFGWLGIFLAWDGHRQNKKIEKLFKQIKNEQGEQGKEV
jgi:hypothetical protein